MKALRGHCENTLSTLTTNIMCDACVMHTCTGLEGPKRENVKKVLVFKAFLNGSKGARARQPNEQRSEPDRLGGGRGRVNLPLVGLFEVLEGWRLGQGIYTPRGQRPRRIVVVSLSRCRRAPPRAMCRKIRRARPPLSYAVSIRTHRRGDPPVRSTQSRYGCFNKNNPPRRPTRKIDAIAVWLFR